MNAVVLRLEVIACPLCYKEESTRWGEENGYTAVKCSGCGLVYVNPRPTSAEISEANRSGEHRTAGGSLDVRFRRSRRKLRHYRSLIRQLFSAELQVWGPIRWLDIGAGYGEFLEALAGLLPPGSSAEGIEPMEEKVRQARERGLNVSTIALTEIHSKFDVVSLINVVSHIPDFDSFASQIRSVLKERGLLFVETGNGGDLTSETAYPDRLFLPDHLAFLGKEHLRIFLERNGFEVLMLQEARLDTAFWMLKNAIKYLLGRDVKLSVPYSSQFRTVFVKARLKPTSLPTAISDISKIG